MRTLLMFLATGVVAGAMLLTGPGRVSAQEDDNKLIKIEGDDRFSTRVFLVKETIGFFSGQIDAAIDREKKLIEGNSTDAEKDAARKKIKSMQKFKVWVELPKNAAEFCDLANGAKDALLKIDKEFRGAQVIMEKQTIWPLQMDMHKLGTYVKGVSYGLSAYRLYSDLQTVDSYGYDGNVGKLVKWTKFVSAVGSEFAAKVPLIGDLLKGYADVTGEMLNLVNGLNKQFEKFDQGHIGWGTHGAGKVRNVAWNQQNMEGTAVRVPGFRDFYESISGNGDIFLWDDESFRTVEIGGKATKLKGRWWNVKETIPGATLDTIRGRYMTLFRGGNKSPKAQDVLKGYRQMAFLAIELSVPGVAPGQVFTVTPLGTRVHDRQPITSAWGRIYEEGSKEQAKECKLGEAIPWTAARTPGQHKLVLELDEATAKVWKAVGKTQRTYYVGTPTTTRLSAQPKEVILGQKKPVRLLVSVKGPGDAFVERGYLQMSATPSGGFFAPRDVFAGRDLNDGNVSVAWEPLWLKSPGTVVIKAAFEGYESKGEGFFMTPSQDEVEIRVNRAIATRIVGNKKRIENGWNITARVLDADTQPVPVGKLEFLAKGGGFQLDGGALLAEVSRDAAEAAVKWVAPPGRTEPAEIRLLFRETKSSQDYAVYLRSETVLTLEAPAAGDKPGQDEASGKEAKDTGSQGGRKGDGLAGDTGGGAAQKRGTANQPLVNNEINFGRTVKRPEPDGDDERTAPLPELPDAEDIGDAAFQWGRMYNGGLPLAPLAESVDMGEEGRPEASATERPEYQPVDYPFMHHEIPGGAKQKRSNYDRDGKQGHQIAYSVGKQYVGARFYVDGELVEQWPVLNGNVHGAWILLRNRPEGRTKYVCYRDNGVPKVLRTYRGGELVSTAHLLQADPKRIRYIEFDSKGRIKHQATYASGQLLIPPYHPEDKTPEFDELIKGAHGLVKIWADKGDQVVFEGVFDEGKCVWKRAYHATGAVAEEVTFDEKGDMHGFRRLWLPGGEPFVEESLDHGKKHGVCRYWVDPEKSDQPAGTLIKEEHYQQDVLARRIYYFETNPDYAREHSAAGENDFDVSVAVSPGAEPMPMRKMTWFPDRSCSTYRTFKEKKPHGLHWTFHANGHLEQMKPFVEGVLDGEERRYHEDGRPAYRVFWAKGVKHGLEVEFGASGKRVHQRPFDHGKLHGVEVLFDDFTGQRVEEIRYRSDEKEGDHVLFDSVTGAKTRVTGYRKNVKHGLDREYSDHGQLILEAGYENGVLSGEYRKWTYTTGSLLEKGRYFKGSKDGEYLKFDWHGAVTLRENYRRGQKHGPQVYDEGTRNARTEYYVDGQMSTSGRWQEYLKELGKAKGR